MVAAKKTEEIIEIPAIELEEFNIRIVGDSPLIVHKWSEKAKKQILDKQMKKASKGREAKDPWQDYCDSMYWLSEKPEHPTQEDIDKATFGFPIVAFKAAAVDGGYQSGVIKTKTIARAAFHIKGEFAVIDGKPEPREDMVRIALGGTDIRYRGEFKEWATTLTIVLNRNAMSKAQVVNLMNLGGFACGIGEWRNAKDGGFGAFHVE